MSRSYPVDPKDPSAEVINVAATTLDSGGVVIFPTETVYGIGAKANTGCGCEELFEIKMRDTSKPIPWLVEDEAALALYGVDIPPYAYKLAAKFWPGALTLVVKAGDNVDKDFRAADGTLAMRAPNNEVCQALLRAVGAPIITSSANTHKLPAPADFKDIEPRILEAADIALDAGATEHGKESTVVLCVGEKPEIWREGAIKADEVFAALEV